MVNILAIQQKFIDAGFMFQETIFNDGKPNCSIRFTKDTSPHNFTYGNNLMGDVGWGRFDREYAWLMAEEWLDKYYGQKQA